MQVTVDKYGRIVIPKPVRERLGLEAGSSLELEIASTERGDAMALRPTGQEPALRRQGDLLIHTGRLTDETYDVVEDLRRRRTEHALGSAGYN